MNLPPEARSVVVGSLLGDAYLYPNGTLQIEHRLDHAEYVWWKYERLRSIAGKPPTKVERRDSRTSRVHRSLRFYTKTVLEPYRDVFYRDRKKVVPVLSATFWIRWRSRSGSWTMVVGALELREAW